MSSAVFSNRLRRGLTADWVQTIKYIHLAGGGCHLFGAVCRAAATLLRSRLQLPEPSGAPTGHQVDEALDVTLPDTRWTGPSTSPVRNTNRTGNSSEKVSEYTLEKCTLYDSGWYQQAYRSDVAGATTQRHEQALAFPTFGMEQNG